MKSIFKIVSYLKNKKKSSPSKSRQSLPEIAKNIRGGTIYAALLSLIFITTTQSSFESGPKKTFAFLKY